MSTPSCPIRLKDSSGDEQTFYNSQADISWYYTIAEVLNSEPHSVWVVYTVTEWDHKHPGDRNVEKIVCTGERVTMDNPIKSIQGYDELNPGVILFEHSQYRGYASLFRNSNTDVTQSFRQGQISGVSSMIITGGMWSFYNFTGIIIKIDGKTLLGPGKYDLGPLPANDQIKSIKYVQAS